MLTLVDQVYDLSTLTRCPFFLQQRSSFIGQQSKNRRRGRGGRLNLSYGALLEMIVVVERVESAVAEQGM